MGTMTAPLPLASAICHLATLGLIMNIHVELSTVRDMPAGPHRTLLEPVNTDSLVTVAHMNTAVDRLQDTLGSRLTAVEREYSELKASLQAQADSTARSWVDTASRRSLSVDAESPVDAVDARWEDSLQKHGVRLDELKAQVQADLASAAETTRAYIDARLDEDSRRRAQGAEPEPEPEPLRGENVKIIKPAVVRCGGPGGTTSDGHFDYARCASDSAFAVCHATACAGHTATGGHPGHLPPMARHYNTAAPLGSPGPEN
jgi:hypothetical protein